MIPNQLVHLILLLCMEQNIKLTTVHVTTTCTITMCPVLSAMLPPELQWSWFLLKLSAHLPGPGSTMATSWQNTIVINDHHLTVLMSILTLCQVKLKIQMVHYFITSLPHAMASSVHRMWPIRWCPVLCAQSEHNWHAGCGRGHKTNLEMQQFLVLDKYFVHDKLLFKTWKHWLSLCSKLCVCRMLHQWLCKTWVSLMQAAGL